MGFDNHKKRIILLVVVLGICSLFFLNRGHVFARPVLMDYLSDFFTFAPIIENSGSSDLPLPTSTPSTRPAPTLTPPPPEGMIYVDHTSIALFEDIPAPYLEAARNLTMMFSDRSVGDNISDGLDCLMSASEWAETLSHCREDYYAINGSTWLARTYNQTDYDQGLVPERILFDPDPLLYSRANWTYEFRGGSWSDLTQDFIEVLAPSYLDEKEVLTYQFSYLNVMDGDDIADPNSGFFADVPNRYDVYDLEAFIAQHPDKTFIFWTTSLARGIGTQVATDFNNMMRQYAIANDKILFDVADILAHTDLGAACYDNRDGVEYCQESGECEDYADDGLNLPAICQDWTTEIDGGHLGSVSGGKIQIAKAFWVLMAQIAGWAP